MKLFVDFFCCVISWINNNVVCSVQPKDCLFAGVVNDRGKTYGIYAVSVAKCYETGYTEKWHVYRRYSDFHDLHQKVKDKVTVLCIIVVLFISQCSA